MEEADVILTLAVDWSTFSVWSGGLDDSSEELRHYR
jgi:hypothetical protein